MPPPSPRQSCIIQRDADDTRVVPWDLLMRLLTDDDGDATTIQLARLHAVRELYAAGDAKGALIIAALLEEELCTDEDDVTVEIVGEDEVELLLVAGAEPPRSAPIHPSRIVMVVAR